MTPLSHHSYIECNTNIFSFNIYLQQYFTCCEFRLLNGHRERERERKMVADRQFIKYERIGILDLFNEIVEVRSLQRLSLFMASISVASGLIKFLCIN